MRIVLKPSYQTFYGLSIIAFDDSDLLSYLDEEKLERACLKPFLVIRYVETSEVINDLFKHLLQAKLGNNCTISTNRNDKQHSDLIIQGINPIYSALNFLKKEIPSLNLTGIGTDIEKFVYLKRDKTSICDGKKQFLMYTQEKSRETNENTATNYICKPA